jgi:serine phosphatase RsbU (regulator of sigma subunit)/RimJ/RimL family protein N-acetyltransferase
MYAAATANMSFAPTNSADTAHTAPAFRIRTAVDLCRKTLAVDVDTRNRDVYELLESDPTIMNIPVTENGMIVGLINRDGFIRNLAGRFRWDLFSKKRCAKLMDKSPLVVDAALPIRDLATHLLNPDEPHRLSEGFIVTRSGELLGTGLTSDVLAAITMLEQMASDALRRHRDSLSDIVEQRTQELLLSRQTEEKQRIENTIAKEIIDRLMLRQSLQDKRLSYWFMPAERISGDVIAAAHSPAGIHYAMLADATGHGLTPAISIVPALTLFYHLVGQEHALDRIVSELNRELRQTMPVDRFVAATLVAIDPTRRSCTYWQGGLPEMLHLDAKGDVKQRYPSFHPPLGILDFDQHGTEVRSIPFDHGDQFVLFTDGLEEATSPTGEEFGGERIARALLRNDAHSQIDALQTSLERHLADTIPHDDISLLVIDCAYHDAPQISAGLTSPSTQRSGAPTVGTTLSFIEPNTHCRTINGKELRFRPVSPDDQDRLLHFLNALSYSTRYLRFGSGCLSFTADQTARFCDPSPQEWRRFIVVTDDAGTERQVASASYYIQEDQENCDLTILVADEWHGSRLAHWLLTNVLDDARRCGLRRVIAQILGTNQRMIRFAQRHGFAVTPETRLAPIKILVLLLDQLDEVDPAKESPQ